jgi:SAM-dependent methyltransferase
MLTTSLCTQESFSTDAFRRWTDRLPLAQMGLGHYLGVGGEPLYLNRKLWEWVFIAEALYERGMLAPGHRGLGFGVGREPLPALFAGFGCEIVATDESHEEAAAAGWVRTGQHANAPDDLNAYGLCDPEQFARLVSFREVDMNSIPGDLRGFDFCWSACALEHLGSIAHGQDFMIHAIDCVRPGGVAVHTTEYNVSSDTRTVDNDGTVVFRRRDVTWLSRRLQALGHDVSRPDLNAGTGPADRHVDVPPYSKTHLKVALGEHVVTSVGMIVERNLRPRRPLPTLGLPVHRARKQLGDWSRARRAASKPNRFRAPLMVNVLRIYDRAHEEYNRLTNRRRETGTHHGDLAPLDADQGVAYLVSRMLPGKRVVDVSWTPACRLAPLRVCRRTPIGIVLGQGRVVPDQSLPFAYASLPRLPFADSSAEILIVLDVLQALPPRLVGDAIGELARVASRFVFASVPSFGVDGFSPPNGRLDDKVDPELLAHYASLGEAYEGPIPAGHLLRGANPPFETVASIAWWTRQFEQAGLCRCAGVEQRLVPFLEQLGLYGQLKLYVLRRPDVPEPVGEIHTPSELDSIALALEQMAPRTSA